MRQVGIETMGFYGGSAYIDVEELARHRNLDKARFENLLMKEKAVALPCEDPVSFAINAAKPVIDSLSAEEKDRIELLITCTESGIDFGKSISTYVHSYLELNRNCRLFEIKQACYSGVAGLQMAINFVLSQVSPGAKALVVTTDIARYVVQEGTSVEDADWSFAEPSSGAGAVAMLVGESPSVFIPDVGANGYYGYEVMDTCRPVPDGEAGDSDLSLMSYLDCCAQTFVEYKKRVPNAQYDSSFDYLSFHAPFGGMVKGAHRTMMRKFAQNKSVNVEDDFEQRASQGLKHCQRVGNIMGGTAMLSLLSVIDHADVASPKRVGCFSYGSGCCSEFFSGIITPQGQQKINLLNISESLSQRQKLSMSEYDAILKDNYKIKFGVQNLKVPSLPVQRTGSAPRIYLKEIVDFKRVYEWQ